MTARKKLICKFIFFFAVFNCVFSYKRKNSSDRGSVEFNRRITVQNDRFKETNKAKGNVKARLGGQVKSNIKSRLGGTLHNGIESRLGKKIER